MTFTNFEIERTNGNNHSNYSGQFTGDAKRCLRYQAKKIGLEFAHVIETADYYRVSAPQGQIALTVYK